MDTPLKAARLKTKQTQAEVAKALGIDQGSYHRIESGERCPTPQLARRIAAHFGDRVTPMEIMDPEFYMPNGESD